MTDDDKIIQAIRDSLIRLDRAMFGDIARGRIVCDFIRRSEYKALGKEIPIKLPYWVTSE